MTIALEPPSLLMGADAEHRRAAALTRVAEALEAVYRRCPELPVLALRWMCLKHPLHEVQERLLDAAQGTASPAAPQPALRWWGRMGRCVMFGVYLSLCVVRLRWRTRGARRLLRAQEFGFVARTCCFQPTAPADGVDFYYGNLQQRLVQQGHRMLLLCGDGSNSRWTDFAEGQTVTSGWCRLPELALVPPLAPLQMAVQQVRSSIRLRAPAARLSDPVEQRIAQWAGRDCLTGETALSGLLSWVGREAARVWRPRAFVTLYEGHAWERCLWRGVKTAAASCRTVGYQHTAVFRESRAVLTPPLLGPWAVPDVVLALGEVPLELMRPGHARFQTRLIRFGSFRAQAGHQPQPPDPTRRTVLVTPEGIPSETQRLFEFAAACAQRLPSYIFLLRCHPQIPMATALELASIDVARHPNLVLSDQRGIEEDFRRASVLLYRGSSAVMYGIVHGLLPLYLQVDGLVDRDPLYYLGAWRRRCARPEEAAAVLEEHARAPLASLQGEWQEALRYVNDYTGPVTDEGLEALLAAAGVGRGAP